MRKILKKKQSSQVEVYNPAPKIAKVREEIKADASERIINYYDYNPFFTDAEKLAVKELNKALELDQQNLNGILTLFKSQKSNTDENPKERKETVFLKLNKQFKNSLNRADHIAYEESHFNNEKKAVSKIVNCAKLIKSKIEETEEVYGKASKKLSKRTLQATNNVIEVFESHIFTEKTKDDTTK